MFNNEDVKVSGFYYNDHVVIYFSYSSREN